MALKNPFKQKKKEVGPLKQVDPRKQFFDNQRAELDKEYQQKLFIEQYARRIGVSAVVVIAAIFGGLALWLGFDSIVAFFSNEPEPVEVVDMPPDDFAIKTEDIKVVPSGFEDRYDVFARLSNVDREWGVAELEYTFRLLNAAGEVVGEESDVTYILPGEQRSLLEVNVLVSDTPSSVEMEMNPRVVQKLKQITRLDFSFPFVAYDERLGKGRVRGTIKNDTAFAFDQVDLDIIVFNRQNEIVALNKTNVNALVSGEQRDFVVTWPEQLGSDLQVQVQPHVNVFLSSAFLNVYSEGAQIDF